MKPYVLFLLLLSAVPALSQTSEAEQIREIARDLVDQLSRQKVKKIALVRLEYRGNESSEIGKYFADEMAYALSRMDTKFDVISPAQVEDALYEEERDRQRKEMERYTDDSTPSEPAHNRATDDSNDKDKKINPWVIGGVAAAAGALLLFSRNNGPLTGVKHYLGGKIVDEGDELMVTFEAVDQKKLVRAASRGRFVKSPKISSLIELVAAAPVQQPIGNYPPPALGNPTSPGPIPQGEMISWRNNSVVIELKSCVQSGQNIDCMLQVTARSSNINMKIYFRETAIFAAENQHEYYPNEIVIGDKSSTNYAVEKTLIGSYNAPMVIRYRGVMQRINNIAALTIGGNDGHHHFNAELNNIPVY